MTRDKRLGSYFKSVVRCRHMSPFRSTFGGIEDLWGRMLRNGRLRRTAMSLILMSVCAAIMSSTAALAQIAKTNTTQRILIEKPANEKVAMLAEIVRKAWPARKCSPASASLEKTSDNGDGGWLVTCDDEYDYWVLVPAATTTSTVLPCILARNAGVDCYVNLRTVAPEHVNDCNPSSTRTDPTIRSCTVIIQSGRLVGKPEALAIVYAARAIAYGRYDQKDLALSDFDKAVALQPDDINHRFNRAIALERKGKYDQAIADLDKILSTKPDSWSVSYERGYVFMQKGNYDRAIDDFDQVLRINPGFEKAVQQRASALQAKQNGIAGQGLPPKSPLSDASGPGSRSNSEQTETELDRKAAYCMEASFGFSQRATQFIQLLQQNRDKVQALQRQTSISKSDLAKVQDAIRQLDGNIAESEASRAKWDGNLKVFIGYLQQHGLLSQKSNSGVIATMSAKVVNDQREVQESYKDCLRTCSSGEDSCKKSCNKAAEASEASQRMKQCERVAKDIR